MSIELEWPRLMETIAALLLSIAAPALAAQEAIELQRGKPLVRRIAANEVHRYTVSLVPGGFLRARFDQRGVDVVVTVYAPDGSKIVEVDAPVGGEGPEVLEVVASTPGAYRIEVSPFSAESRGTYEAAVEVLMTAEEYAAHRAAERELAEHAAKELANLAIPLRSVEPGESADDMVPIGVIVGEARIVALGEATHGTREFRRLKHRLFEYLATTMGFTVFALEAPMPEAFDLNEYVLTGEGDPRKALTALGSWVWNTEDMLELVEWMARYNADSTHPQKLKFYGIDATRSVRAAKRTLEYFGNVDDVAAETIDALRLLADPVTNRDFDRFSDGRKRATVAFVDRLLRRRGSPSLVRQHARVLAQNLSARMNRDGGVHDKAMAENIRWILAHEGVGTRMVVSAHNNHVAADGASMGAHLQQEFGEQLLVIGFAFAQGSFQALEPGVGLRSFSVPPASEATIDTALAAAELPALIIDLRSIPRGGAAARWLAEPRATRDIGATYREADAASYIVKRPIVDRYDGLAFIDRTTPSRLNPEGRVISAIQPLPEPANLDFENVGEGGAPADWLVLPPVPAVYDFEIMTSESNRVRGRRAAVLRRPAARHYGETAASLSQFINAESHRGKRLRLRASARVVNARGKAFLWMRTHRAEERREIDTGSWKVYELTLVIPENASTIEYGLSFGGDGEAWIDAVEITN